MNFIATPLPLIKVLTLTTPAHMRTEHSIGVRSNRHPRIFDAPLPLLWWLCCLLPSSTQSTDYQKH